MAEPQDSPVIRISGVSLRTNHGVTEAEREIGQRMIFDLELVPVECTATATDDIDGTVDYGELAAYVEQVATATGYRTLERLTTVIAEGILDRFAAESVRVRATKPEPPVPQQMDGASVEVFRRRDG